MENEVTEKEEVTPEVLPEEEEVVIVDEANRKIRMIPHDRVYVV